MRNKKVYSTKVDAHLKTAGHLFASGAKQAAVLLKDGSFEIVYAQDYEDILYLSGDSVESVIRTA